MLDVYQLIAIGPWEISCSLKSVIFKLISRIDTSSISCEIALMWMPQDFTDD